MTPKPSSKTLLAHLFATKFKSLFTWENDILENPTSFLIQAIVIASFLSVGVTMPSIDLMTTIQSSITFNTLIFASLATRMPTIEHMPLPGY
jgi:hypothetical protein